MRRYHCTPVRVAVMMRIAIMADNAYYCRYGEIRTFWVAYKPMHFGKQCAVPQKVKIELPFDLRSLTLR